MKFTPAVQGSQHIRNTWGRNWRKSIEEREEASWIYRIMDRIRFWWNNKRMRLRRSTILRRYSLAIIKTKSKTPHPIFKILLRMLTGRLLVSICPIPQILKRERLESRRPWIGKMGTLLSFRKGIMAWYIKNLLDWRKAEPMTFRVSSSQARNKGRA